MEVRIHGSQIGTRKELHEALAQGLELPEWYGNNLDALYDCLTDIHEETSIQILEKEELEKVLGPYVKSLMRLLRRVEDENPHIHLILEE